MLNKIVLFEVKILSLLREILFANLSTLHQLATLTSARIRKLIISSDNAIFHHYTPADPPFLVTHSRPY